MRILLQILILLSVACTQVKVIKKDELYSKTFLSRIHGIEEIFKSGEKELALKKLGDIKDKELNPAEKAYKYNLEGVILFSKENYSEALTQFLLAKDASRQDQSLVAEVDLNLSSTYYKLSDFKKAYEHVADINPDFLDEQEIKKAFQLKYMLASSLEKKKEVVESLIILMSDLKSMGEIESSEFKDPIIENFQSLSSSEQVYTLEKFENKKYLIVAYLGKNEVMSRYYSGDKSGAKDVMDWLEKNFNDNVEIQAFISDLNERLENVSKIDSHMIGVVLPLNSAKKDFSIQALTGIESTLKSSKFQKYHFKVIVKDNQDSPLIAREAVRDLIQNDHVAVVIGGIFPHTATAEYKEAVAQGVLFISLSPVYIPKEEKNHLLIEIQGSVQSQVASMIQPKVLERIGNRVGLLYSKNEAGEAFAEEFYRQHTKGSIKLGSVGVYDRQSKDFRPDVEKLLGLNNQGDRAEEAAMWKKIYALEGKTRIRRIQTLPPVVEFDWIYLPAVPQEALQILPIFSYFDAQGLKYVGGPSWFNKLILKEQRNLGKVFFVGDDPKDFDETFFKEYQNLYARPPRVLEIHSIEASYLAASLLSEKNFSKRQDFEDEFKKMEKINGLVTNYHIEDGVWIKEMDFMKMTQGKILKIDESASAVEEAAQ